jgi:hypothetical protein
VPPPRGGAEAVRPISTRRARGPCHAPRWRSPTRDEAALAANLAKSNTQRRAAMQRSSEAWLQRGPARGTHHAPEAAAASGANAAAEARGCCTLLHARRAALQPRRSAASTPTAQTTGRVRRPKPSRFYVSAPLLQRSEVLLLRSAELCRLRSTPQHARTRSRRCSSGQRPPVRSTAAPCAMRSASSSAWEPAPSHPLRRRTGRPCAGASARALSLGRVLRVPWRIHVWRHAARPAGASDASTGQGAYVVHGTEDAHSRRRAVALRGEQGAVPCGGAVASRAGRSARRAWEQRRGNKSRRSRTFGGIGGAP